MKNRFLLTAALVLVSLSLYCYEASKAQASDLDYDLYQPQVESGFPCVVICPGRGYHKDLPLITKLGEGAAEAGIATLAYNWSYFTEGNRPSDDGSRELADIDSAINLAKAIPGADTARVFLAGKSMGSVYGYHAFRNHPELAAYLSLTPIIPESGMGEAYYPKLAEEEREVVFVLGDQDTDNCSLANLYEYLSAMPKPSPVVVVSGAHSFEEAGPESSLQDTENLDMAVQAVIYWLKKLAGL